MTHLPQWQLSLRQVRVACLARAHVTEIVVLLATKITFYMLIH